MGDSLGYSFQWSGGKFTVFNPPFSVESKTASENESVTVFESAAD
jgi:hypothetical protein